MKLLDRLYGSGKTREFKGIMRAVKPDVAMTIRMDAERIPILEVVWNDGAYIKFRVDVRTVHIQELANSSSGDRAEGLYQKLIKSGLPEFWKSCGCDTMTCEPSDDGARQILGRYGAWEEWQHDHMHDVWIWWLSPRTLPRAGVAIGTAHQIQKERQ